MEFSDLNFKKTLNGIHASVKFGPYELSVARNSATYGNKQGLYEIAVLKDGKFTPLSGVTNEDGIQGWLKESSITEILRKMTEITEASGEIV